jgi:ABC-type multidrug transport system ATPase subunit
MSQKELNSPIGFPLQGRGVGVRLNNVGKRFNREWIFRHFNYQFMAGKSYAITGSNGSGKSTLLQVIAGSLTHNEGTIEFNNGQQSINNEQLYAHISIAAPYLELVEEMSAKEMLEFHAQFKPLVLPIAEALQIVGLEKATDKKIRYYSSGMKQRLKLAQAFFSNTPVLLLDEPTTNLDADGIALYHHLIDNYTSGKLIIVSSNDTQEYNFCGEVIKIGEYK